MKAVVNNRFEYEMPDRKSLECVSQSDDTIWVRHNAENYLIEILESNVRERKIVLSVNGYIFDVSLHHTLDDSVRAIQSHLVDIIGKHEYRAPIPGVVKSIPIEKGQPVQQGEVLLVLEAMKMENTILAIKDGEELKYHVAPGESVVKGQLLCSQE